MRPHPDFADWTIPPAHDLPSAHLRMLTVADLDEDMDAILESAEALVGTFGDDWPRGLTKDEDLVDLAWHQREFTSQRSFAWVVRDPATGRYEGCAYVFPVIGTRGKADVYLWLRTGSLLDAGIARSEFRSWLESAHWPDIAWTWPGGI